MGGSSWHYFVPYSPDIAAALQVLRRDVFKRGDYKNAEPDPAGRAAELETEVKRLRATGDEVDEAIAADFEEIADSLRRIESATTIDEVIEATVRSTHTEGTHSILDVSGVADTPTPGKLSPLTSQELTQHVGTTQPTRSQLESTLETLFKKKVIWRSLPVYAVVYDESGTPSELFFAGISGD